MPTIYKEHVSRLAGYPQLNSDNDLELAVYVMVSGYGVVSGGSLASAITQASSDIESQLGELSSPT